MSTERKTENYKEQLVEIKGVNFSEKLKNVSLSVKDDK